MARVVELLGDRYELEELVGSGGMGEVFRAHDLLLDRVVAVKRPSAPLTGSSRERFRREARAAARLNHPHIVAVHDWGETGSVPERETGSVPERETGSVPERQDGDTSFIVMEYVEGRSLRAVLQEQGPIRPGEVAHVGAQIADALAHAHSKGIVHRDVKPSNVLLTSTGSVKVTDFGIAQSTASEALTEPGAVVGTAGYLAPEQIAGLPADARSDVYSLGVVLTELLTGARDPLPPELPGTEPGATSELLRVIARARAEDSGDRYQRAVELREALRECARSAEGDALADVHAVAVEALTGALVDVPTASSPPLTGALVDVPTAPPAPLTGALVDVPTASVPPPPATIATIATPTVLLPAEPSPPPAMHTRRQKRDERRERKAAKRATAAKPAPKPERERRWKTPHVAWLVAAPVTIALVAAGALAYRALTARPDVTVPSVVGRDIFSAAEVLDKAGFEVETVIEQSARPAGTILAQRPRDGRRIPEGDTITITVSDIRAAMPDIVGADVDEALAELRDVGLVNVAVVDDYRDDEAPGTVVTSDPLPYQGALKQGTVTLVVARDPRVTVPNVVGLDEDAARATLEGLGLVVIVQPTSHRSVLAGVVISSSPGLDKVSLRGNTVTLKVSSGPKLLAVPYVVSDDADDAIDELQGAGFAVTVATTPASSSQVGRVVAQDPSGGQAAEGSTVTVTVGARSR